MTATHKYPRPTVSFHLTTSAAPRASSKPCARPLFKRRTEEVGRLLKEAAAEEGLRPQGGSQGFGAILHLAGSSFARQAQ